MFAKGYFKGKVWNNGYLKEDIEADLHGDNKNIRVIVRDKNVISDMVGPTSDILRAVFSKRPNHVPLEQRLIQLGDLKNVNSKTKKVKNIKSKTKKSKTKKNKLNKNKKVVKHNTKLKKNKSKNKTKKNRK
jgi:hypothetical protein